MYRPFKFKPGDILEHTFRYKNQTSTEYHLVVYRNRYPRYKNRKGKPGKEYGLVFATHAYGRETPLEHYAEQHYIDYTYMWREGGTWRKIGEA